MEDHYDGSNDGVFPWQGSWNCYPTWHGLRSSPLQRLYQPSTVGIIEPSTAVEIMELSMVEIIEPSMVEIKEPSMAGITTSPQLKELLFFKKKLKAHLSQQF